MSLSSAFGFQNLLKDGYKHYQGLEEAILRNIDACKKISLMTKTSLGPYGMNKMVINHLDKIFITSDAATILKEVEVHHPAAKMIALAAHMQEEECGDMTNFVITFAGELLQQAELLIKTGVHPSDIVSGYDLATKEAIKIIEGQCKMNVTDFKDRSQVLPVINSVLCPKIPAYYEHFGNIVTDACIRVLGDRTNSFDTEYIRITKIMGGSLYDSEIVNGMIMTRAPETSFRRFENAKVAVYMCPFVMEGGETKSNLLIKNAEDLLNFSKSEEAHMEKLVKEIADTGVKVVVIGGSISELANHYFEKYQIMSIKSMSKFEVKRLCKCINAQAMAKLGAPLPEEIGQVDLVHVKEIGSDNVTIFERNALDTALVTVLLRGSTSTLLDDIARAVDDAINCFKSMVKGNRFLQGAGATDSYVANAIAKFAEGNSSMEQYALTAYGEAFNAIPNILLNNAGLNANIHAPTMSSGNVEGPHQAVDVMNGTLKPVAEVPVWDHLDSRVWAVRLASDAAITILKVDQIIVAKPAGGPKPKSQSGWDNDDDNCC